jgi:hypothetical protein
MDLERSQTDDVVPLAPTSRGLSAAEWGAREAAKAPPWSDQMWRTALATLGIRVATPDPREVP